MSETEWFCGVQLGGVKLPAEFPAARNSKSMVHAGTGRWRQKNGRPMLIVGSRLAVYRMAVVEVVEEVDSRLATENVHSPHHQSTDLMTSLHVDWTVTYRRSRCRSNFTGMDKTCLHTGQLWEFICDSLCPRHVERNYVPLFGVPSAWHNRTSTYVIT